MSNIDENLISWLFETNALRVCPEEKPFWYTSGTIGPYYINTHFLVGSEEKANEILEFIDKEKEDKLGVSEKLLKIFSETYSNDEIFKPLVDSMCKFIKDNINVDEIDYVSGGERRDWFFSLIIAKLLGKPHITIFKDLDAVVFDGVKSQRIDNLNGAKVIHVADLVTEASSFDRAWIPAVSNLGGKIFWSVVVVDRCQGGGELLSSKGIRPFSMIDVNKGLFQEAVKLNYINNEQYSLIAGYVDNPKESMQEFLLNHPMFIQDALQADKKTQERARLCLDKKIYNI